VVVIGGGLGVFLHVGIPVLRKWIRNGIHRTDQRIQEGCLEYNVRCFPLFYVLSVFTNVLVSSWRIKSLRCEVHFLRSSTLR
jgi:hypothetical protein